MLRVFTNHQLFDHLLLRRLARRTGKDTFPPICWMRASLKPIQSGKLVASRLSLWQDTLRAIHA